MVMPHDVALWIFSHSDEWLGSTSTCTANSLQRSTVTRKLSTWHELRETVARAASRKLLGLETLTFCRGGRSFDPATHKIQDCVRISEWQFGPDRRYWLRPRRLYPVSLRARDPRLRGRHRRSQAQTSKGQASRQKEPSLRCNSCRPPPLHGRRAGYSPFIGGARASSR